VARTAQAAVVRLTRVTPADGSLKDKTNDEDGDDVATASRTTRFAAND